MEYVKFGELYSIPSSNGVSRPSAVRGKGYKMINMGELFANDIISDMPMERVHLSPKEKEKFLVQENDLLFARQSLVAEGAGKCSIVKQLSEETTFESHLIRVRLNEKLCNPWFYYYLFQLPYNPVKTIVNQCAQAGIRGKELVNIKVPLPSIEVQNKIANALSTFDELIENNNKRIKLLEQMAENLFKEWFVRFRFPGHETAKFENGLPEGWMVMRVKDLVKRYPFGTLYKGDSILSEGKTIVIDQSSNEYAGFHNNEPSHIADINYPMILFGDHTCKYQLMTIPFSLSENVVPFTGTEGVDTTYLYYLVNGIVETTEYKRHWTEFVSKKVLVADNKSQRLFRDKIKDKLLLIEFLKLQNRNLTKQRDLLLPRLMSGKLEV